ncbi:MFS transporter [Pseudomonas kurunegalensis]|uniref:MFS transporter n=1 Tax=Pseudomonas kurunegalensis TaxID=485880 RepID=UPI00256FDB4A|nr:MFS transporter [Pseudomonas kurunegalensis]WJD60344.1 MFS transporter [Pseudomonas kurunegalensis]
MATPYRELFNAPGSRAFSLAGLLARIPLPMTGIGIITMLSQLRGSYALAGLVSATFVLAYALLSPQVSRLVDLKGQRKVLPFATATSVIGLLVLAASAKWQAPDWSLFIGALLAGFMPSISAMVRARWTALYRGQPPLSTAYSLETVFDEVSFILGPPLAIGLSIMVLPQAALLVAAALLLLGVIALLVQRTTEPAVEAQPLLSARPHSVIRLSSVRLLTLLLMVMGVIVGTVDIVSVAFAEQLNRPAAASGVLSVYAVGSCVSGLLFGALRPKFPLHRQLLVAALATGVTTLPLVAVNSIPGLAVAMLAAGLFFAPTMIVAMTLLERLVPERQVTEGMTWLLAGLNVGVALGAAGAGRIVDAAGVQWGFALALAAGVAVAVVAFRASSHLRRHQAQPLSVQGEVA